MNKVPRPNRRKLTLELEARVCQRYIYGEPCITLAKEYECPLAAIYRILERHEVSRKNHRHRYNCNHDFFRHIHDQEQAYWAGFVAADGCIRDDGSLQLTLSSRDYDHLLSFKDALHSDHPISGYTARSTLPSRSRSTREMSRLVIQSSKLAGSLAKYGIVPRKTYTLTWPDKMLPEHLLQHYLRGYSDGDGWFTTVKSNWIRHDGTRAVNYHWGLLGTEHMCKGVIMFLMRSLDLPAAKMYVPANTDDRIRRFTYGGNKQVARIARLLYSDAQVYLPRKRQVIEHLL